MGERPNHLSPYVAPVSEFTTPADLRREAHARLTGVDPGADWLTRAGQAARVVAPNLLLALNALGPRGGVAMPRPRASTYTLSANEAPSSPYFAYDILRDGVRMGHARGRVVGDTAQITGIYSSGAMRGRGFSEGANEFGPAALMQIREQFRRDFPDVTRFTGWRISGARARTGNPRQEVVIPSIAAPLATGTAGMDWWWGSE